jgi:hypothetical protein
MLTPALLHERSYPFKKVYVYYITVVEYPVVSDDGQATQSNTHGFSNTHQPIACSDFGKDMG